MSNKWRCVLIGRESLLIQCADVLARQGHEIAAIVTSQPPIRQWAEAQGIRLLADARELATATGLGPIDYLFSVTNLSELGADLLALPTRAAINFHDGPLPEYAGLNTPVWALLADEPSHGITWHVMTDQLDRGAILVERRFTLSPGETALTLNTRCYEAGIDSFEELVSGMAEGTLVPRVQSAPVQHYFGRHDRPEAAGALLWDQDATRLAALIRATDFGSYANPVTSAKASIGGQVLRIAAAEIQPSQSDAPPGTVLSLDAEGVRVAAVGGDLYCKRIETQEGRPLSLLELQTERGLLVGQSFEPIEPALARRLSEVNRLVCVHEAFWQNRLRSQTTIELPWVDRSVIDPAPSYAHLDSDIASAWAATGGDSEFSRSETLLGALIAVLARLSDKDSFDLAFADTGLRALTAGLQAWFASPLPLRAALDFSASFTELCRKVRAECAEIQRRGTYAIDLIGRTPDLRAAAMKHDVRMLPVSVEFVARLDDAHAPPGCELAVAFTTDGTGCRWFYDSSKLSQDHVLQMQAQFLALLSAARADASRPVAELPLLDPAGRRQALFDWNATAAVVTPQCIHRQIVAQVERTPDSPAITCAGRTLTYAELDRRSNQLARRLTALGVGPDILVGLMVERSVEMVVGLLAIHKAGGAYVPLDPTYPRDRIAHFIADSRIPVLLTLDRIRPELPANGGRATTVLCLDTDWPSIARESDAAHDGGAAPEHLAYVIYTSGSTGLPKGVMVEHRNVVNFFAGMDTHLAADGPGTWLAVTSLSFDISVLEICWTLTRGFHVLIAPDEDRGATPARGAHAERPLDFSLFYFSSDESEGGQDKYKLLLEGARYADQHGFSAVWTPERHFHAFGGLYPNPAVTGAAVAAITTRVQIRAGSVVLPLHHPLRVAEEWSVVDNLSRGRVGISFASGWQPDDFVLRPQNFADNKQVMLRDIEVVRRLWRGESLPFDGPLGHAVSTRILPRPVQKELPFWVTAAGNPETFAAAGRIGANILTHLLGQTVQELQGKLEAYRAAWQEAGHAGQGCVSLMLHSFVGPDEAQVREKVRQPLIDYLRSSLNLVKQYAWSFPAFKRREGMTQGSAGIDLQSLEQEEMDALLEHSFERYYETSGLFGTPASCLKMIDEIKAIGVDDVACLIDFGVDSETVLEHLPYLNQLRRMSVPAKATPPEHRLTALLRHQGITHLQCTPSMARMLLQDETARAGLAGLKCMMVGGEALPGSLARDLTQTLSKGRLMNMYGPTETTVWSAVHPVETVEGSIPLGRPLVNQSLYILDQRQQPLPVGVPGELVIGGQGVVRGYFNRPELTADRFLPDPHSPTPGGRIYRTGDLARRRPDGLIEFLGRLDHQVKVRGYRIELGEIEAGLLAYPGVSQAVVVARQEQADDVRLVAYLVGLPADAETQMSLRQHLRGRLPEFMVPAAFVVLQALPQTPNGKIDRRALPAPEAVAAPISAASHVAPAGELEETIAGIWKDVLKLSHVSVRDNFFDLGGHSLLAVQAHRRLRDELQRELSITDIFRFPTIQTLSAYLAQDGADGLAARAGTDRAQGRRAAMQRRQASRPLAGAPR